MNREERCDVMIVKMMFVSYFLFITAPGKLEIYHADTSRLREDVA